MAESRTAAQVREEIAEQRLGLAEDAAALRAEARAAAPFALGGLAVLLVLRKGRGLARALALLRLLR